MSLRREPPPPLPPDSLSVLLMRAIGDLQGMEGGEPITIDDDDPARRRFNGGSNIPGGRGKIVVR